MKDTTIIVDFCDDLTHECTRTIEVIKWDEWDVRNKTEADRLAMVALIIDKFKKELENFIACKVMMLKAKEPIVKAPDAYVATRDVDCAGCGANGKCQVTFEYTEGGKIKAANVTRLDDGWKHLPYGNAGGSAPYCPVCLKRMD